jgi:CHAD domain-containing protein
MKEPREIAFSGIATAEDAVRQVLRLRFAECLEKQAALSGADDEAVHAFRLACKRLRYALERFDQTKTVLAASAELLAGITDELGAAHDCVVLAARAGKCGADLVAQRALADRDRYERRAARIWKRGFEENGAFAALAAYTGFHWSPS